MALTMTDHLTMSDENHLRTYNARRDSTWDFVSFNPNGNCMCLVVSTQFFLVCLDRISNDK